jgi:hypothetical protein
MRRKILLSVIAAAGLAACAHGASGPYTPPAAVSGDAAPAKKSKGPTFNILIVLPDARHPHGTSATVHSLRVTGKAGNKKFDSLTQDQPGCYASNSGGFGGCGVELAGTTPYVLKNALFRFYATQNGKGCVLAAGRYSGNASPGYPIPVPFKVENAGKCWK